MSGSFPWVKIAATFAGFLGLGYVTMIAVTPTPEQLYAKMSDEMRHKVDNTRRQREMAEAAQSTASQQTRQKMQNPDAQEPVWVKDRKQ